MVASHNNGPPPPINYSTHPERCQPPSHETAPQPPSPSRCETAPQPPSHNETAPQPPSRSSHWYIYDKLPASPRHTLVRAQSAASPSASVAPEAPLDSLTDALEGLSIGGRHTAPLARHTAPLARHTAPLATPTASPYGPVPAPPAPPVTHAIGARHTAPLARHTAPLATPAAPAYGPVPASSAPPPVTHALPVPFAHITPGHKTQKKYYCVTVGKCCGVFSNWNFVTTLVSGVSGSSFIGFKSYEDAIENYYEAKVRGCVRVEREPGDEARFGLLSQAIM